MTIKRDVELIEDGRRYKQALLDIAKLVDSPHRYKSHQIMDIIIEAKAAFGEHAPKSGPWSILTDHVARCENCEPKRGDYHYRGVSILGILVCPEGRDLLRQFHDYQQALRNKADKEALK